MSTSKDEKYVEMAQQTVKRIQKTLNTGGKEAREMAILAELKAISEKLEDIEVHTNNTVRKI